MTRAAGLLLVVGPAGVARADSRGAAFADLCLHVGDTEQGEVAHYGLFPSIVLGGRFGIDARFEIEAAVAAAKTSAVWENIGGVATGYLGGRVRLGKLTLGAGATLPIDRSLPAADCFMPEHAGGDDSLVLDYGTRPACWDRSAYRRAMLHRGGWNAWLWAPDFVSGVASARFDGGTDDVVYAIEAGGAIAFGDGTALIGQLGGEVAYRAGRWSFGGRAAIMGVLLDDASPALVSIEPYVELAPRDGVRLRASVLVPAADLSNDDVSPGLGDYDPPENTSIGLMGAIAF